MGKKEFDTFLKNEESKKEPAVDREAERIWWIKQLGVLFSEIKGWLKEYIETKKINLEIQEIEIFEAALGTYTVQEITIKIGNKVVKLTPIGTILIGTKGRVDMVGKTGTVRFILADKKAVEPKIEFGIFPTDEAKKKHQEAQRKKERTETDWVWKISSSPPKIKYTDLNQDIFLEHLMEVCNG